MNHDATARRIVVGIDGSDCAAHAAIWAADLAARRACTLHLVHALNVTGASSLLTRHPFEEYKLHRTENGEELLDAARADLLDRFPGLWVTGEVAEADPVQTLTTLSADAALVVAGVRGHGGFAGLPLGSVSLRLAAHCRCPAVFVPPQPARPADRSDGEVVLGIDAHEPAAVVEFAFALAAELGTGVRAVHAWEPIPPYNGYYYIDPKLLKAAAESVLADALTQIYEQHYLDARLSRTAVCDRPAAALTDAARGARLLVLGSHRRRTPLSVGIGPVLHALLTHAPCPVAVVPAS